MERLIEEEQGYADLRLFQVLKHHYGYDLKAGDGTSYQVYSGRGDYLLESSEEGIWKWLATPHEEGGPPTRWPTPEERQQTITRYQEQIEILSKSEEQERKPPGSQQGLFQQDPTRSPF